MTTLSDNFTRATRRRRGRAAPVQEPGPDDVRAQLVLLLVALVHDQVLDRDLLEGFGFEGWVQSLGFGV